MNVTFKKSKPAERRFAAYTGNKPASWFVLVDGAQRGEIKGGCGQYSRRRSFAMHIDGRYIGTSQSLAYAKERVMIELHAVSRVSA